MRGSMSGFYISDEGMFKNEKGEPLKFYFTKHDNKTVRINGRYESVGRLVYTNFVRKLKVGERVYHKNGNKDDFRSENLMVK